MNSSEEKTMDNIKTGKKKNSKKKAITLLVFFLTVGFVYSTMGLFVVQPIGAIPEGTTVLYWRYDTKLPFISSADGLLLEKGQGVSLFGRGIVLGAIGKLMEERKIMNLPYSKTLYLISTGGKEFEK
jgi:hypothetical protein